MIQDRVNADLARRVVIDTASLPWQPSPLAGVERRLLDRIGGEVARATSLVRYAASSAFAAHDHALGEEFLVLEGVFSDEHGDYPAGTYVRNPPGSRHTPRSGPGCIILVKLRQMDPTEQGRVVIDTGRAAWQAVADWPGLSRQPLHADDREQVAIEQLSPGARVPGGDRHGGCEILLMEGDLADEHGRYGPGVWLRLPAGEPVTLASPGGARYWVKRGHLRSSPAAG